ncbi:hypothetical protein NIES4071_67490 [Calothrix sp. NIES-4071]|nr:hypothetical protein NIES4071_67490 [Calothrix sp. NIES-4071]BAZ61027.1 hypothetical protein NIES4105_67450 [Calothrix sp. NIES-4105]
MVSVLKYLLSSQLRNSRKVQQNKGFTLIELLVAMIMAALIITPLLGFMINVLDTDRREQAKATSEQEIQTAIDYISRDLEQAIYIYDADGLTRDSNTSPSLSGIKNQIPPRKAAAANCSDANKCEPILVFWKRKLLEDAITVPNSTATDRVDDTFVYSLVAYYLIKDDISPWSKAARIARFEVSDGVQSVGGVTCTDYPNEKYISGRCPNPGFKRFDLTIAGSNLREKMNRWMATSTAYDQRADVLVDFIDQTTTNAPPATCPANTTDTTWSTVAPTSMTGFYACIETKKTLNTTAQVFLRGNALARVQNNNVNYSENNKTYFPTVSTRVEGRSYLFTR